MNRRHFLASAPLCLALLALPAFAGTTNYSPGLVKKELAAGKIVFLDFKADWCTTCAAQERVINGLKSANPAYERNISFINVDWDKFSKDSLTKSLKIPRRSTLVVLQGTTELGRIVAGTSQKDIKALMDTALKASQ